MELTTRERQIVDALAKSGGTNKAIAQELGLSVATVRCHLSHVFSKLGVNTRTQVALWAR